MRTTAVFLTGLILAVAGSATACGGGDADVPLGERLTASAGNPTAVVPTVPPPSVESAPTQIPTPDAATTLQLRSLGRLILVAGDLPAGYTVQNSQAAKAQIVEAQIAIPELALHLRESDLLGAWAALSTNPGPPETGVSSIIYLFTTPEDAQAFVAANGEIPAEDYLSATVAEPLPAEPIGDATVLMHFTTLDGESFEYTWSQGPVAGQVIVRYAAEAPADAVTFTTGLAIMQAQRIATFVP